MEACLSRKSLATRVEEIQQTRAGGRPHRPHPVPLSTTSISTPSHLSPPPLPPPSPPSSVSFSEESELLPPPPPPGRSHALQLMLSPFYRPRLHAHPIPLSPKHSHPPLPQTFPPPPPFPPPPRGGCSTTRCRTMSGANGASRARGTVDRSRRPRGRPQPMGRGACACAEWVGQAGRGSAPCRSVPPLSLPCSLPCSSPLFIAPSLPCSVPRSVAPFSLIPLSLDPFSLPPSFSRARETVALRAARAPLSLPPATAGGRQRRESPPLRSP